MCSSDLIYDIHDWFVGYSIGDPIPEDIHGVFFARQSYILRALLSQDYIKTLKIGRASCRERV